MTLAIGWTHEEPGGMAVNKRLLILVIANLTVSAATLAQFPQEPEALRTPYTTTDPQGMKLLVKCDLHRGGLTVDEEWSNGKTFSFEVDFQKIVAAEPAPPMPGDNWSVMIQQNGGGIRYLILNSKNDALAVAKYLKEMSGLPINDAQEGQASNPLPARPLPATEPPPPTAPSAFFDCPADTLPSCNELKQLLDHNDKEIDSLAHPRNPSAHSYACFSTQGDNNFLIVMFDHPRTSSGRGIMQIESFQEGVQQNAYMEDLKWLSPTLGLITSLPAGNREGGSVTDSTLDFNTAFKNRVGTETHYTLSIRWSTGKYVEDFSSTDNHGKYVGTTRSGQCLQLH